MISLHEYLLLLPPLLSAFIVATRVIWVNWGTADFYCSGNGGCLSCRCAREVMSLDCWN